MSLHEQEVKTWLKALFNVSRETLERLDCFVELVREESSRQNLISQSTLPDIWDRHIRDCAQLVLHAGDRPKRWIDLGSGAGLPGIVVALVSGDPVTLVEFRALRARFLRLAVERTGVADRVNILEVNAAKAPAGTHDVITARAFAPLSDTLAIGQRFTSPSTTWILPRGRRAQQELAASRKSWQGCFRLVGSVTEEASRIVVAQNVKEASE